MKNDNLLPIILFNVVGSAILLALYLIIQLYLSGAHLLVFHGGLFFFLLANVILLIFYRKKVTSDLAYIKEHLNESSHYYSEIDQEQISSYGVKGAVSLLNEVTKECNSYHNNLINAVNRHRSFFINCHAVILVIDPSTADIVDANNRACEFYGHTHREITQMKITDINTLTKDEVFQEMERAKSTKRNYFIFKHRLKNGDIRDVEVYSGKIVLDGRPLLYSIINDISEIKNYQKALNRARLDAIHANQQKGDFLAMMSHELRAPINVITGIVDL